MKFIKRAKFNHFRGGYLLCAALLCLSIAGSCQMQPSTNNAPAPAKRYQMTGRVISVDKPLKTLDIDGDEIPGFMSAMEMPYSVRDPKYLDQVGPGDKIKADLVVAGDGSYLENITVTAKGNPSPPTPPK
jgi:protein SCO1/2